MKKTVKKLTNIRNILDEKVKQKRTHNQKSKVSNQYTGWKTVSEYDKFVIYEINENSQYVFKTSRQKLSLAKDTKNGNSLIDAKHCYFNRNFKNVKSFVTLPASAYHPLLYKQVVLASIQCNQEKPTRKCMIKM